MKITNITCLPVQAPGRTLVPIVVDTDEGISGVGEAGLQRRFHAIDGALTHFRPFLIGEDPRRIEHLWQTMFRGGFYPADKIIGSLIAGIDIALWDIKAKKLGVPVYELFGGSCRDYVQCFLTPQYLQKPATGEGAQDCCKTMSANVDSAASAVSLAQACLEQGHLYFRMGPNPSADHYEPRTELRTLAQNLRAVREAIGYRMELMVDLHARFLPADAIWFANQVEDLGLFLIEDPVRSEHPEAYRLLRKHIRTPLAAGEQWCSKWEFRTAIEEELIDYARIDICIAGGLTEAKKIAAMAEAHMIQILPHNPLGPVNTAAALHLDLSCNNAGPQEVVFPPETMLPDVFACAFRLEGTRLIPSATPGLGVEFDREAAARHPADMTEPPHFRRADGSFTNY